tara:strand:- start:487 stop:696 length:210 start_codon:yes stop_codon:yes gene_type:complete
MSLDIRLILMRPAWNMAIEWHMELLKHLRKLKKWKQEYIENSRIVVRFDCKAVNVPKEIVPPPKPKVST